MSFVSTNRAWHFLPHENAVSFSKLLLQNVHAEVKNNNPSHPVSCFLFCSGDLPYLPLVLLLVCTGHLCDPYQPDPQVVAHVLWPASLGDAPTGLPRHPSPQAPPHPSRLPSWDVFLHNYRFVSISSWELEMKTSLYESFWRWKQLIVIELFLSRLAELPSGEAGFLEEPGGSYPGCDGREAQVGRPEMGSKSQVKLQANCTLPQKTLAPSSSSPFLPHLNCNPLEEKTNKQFPRP